MSQLKFLELRQERKCLETAGKNGLSFPWNQSVTKLTSVSCAALKLLTFTSPMASRMWDSG